jgi:hypothetical protein
MAGLDSLKYMGKMQCLVQESVHSILLMISFKIEPKLESPAVSLCRIRALDSFGLSRNKRFLRLITKEN